MFRAYDIRGVVGDDLTVQAVELVGRAFGTWVRRRDGRSIAVGKDNRASSADFQKALMSGLASTGCAVFDIGLTTTPLMNFTVIDRGLDAGVNITGSHNPVEYNGVKLTGPKGYTLTEEDIQSVRRLAEARDFESGRGSIQLLDAKGSYFDKLTELCHPQRSVRVAVDCGNGVVGAYAPSLIRQLGHDVIELHCELDSSFPNHLPDPEREENMLDLKDFVTTSGCELGIAFDGDGDRLGIVDEGGTHLSSDFVIILLARDLLSRHPGAKILLDVKCSQNVVDDIKINGGEPVLWKTGYPFIRRKIREDRILLAGEQSGHMFFGEAYPYLDDGLLAAGLTLKILSSDAGTLSHRFEGLRRRVATPLVQLPISDDTKFEIVERIRDAVSQLPGTTELIDVDGVRAQFNDDWFVVRASNTSPNLTMRFEAADERSLAQLQQLVFDILSSVLPVSFEDWRRRAPDE